MGLGCDSHKEIGSPLERWMALTMNVLRLANVGQLQTQFVYKQGKTTEVARVTRKRQPAGKWHRFLWLAKIPSSPKNFLENLLNQSVNTNQVMFI